MAVNTNQVEIIPAVFTICGIPDPFSSIKEKVVWLCETTYN